MWGINIVIWARELTTCKETSYRHGGPIEALVQGYLVEDNSRYPLGQLT